MSDKPTVLYRYTGKGEALRNIPARDLTQVDYDRLGLIEQVAVERSDLYKAAEAKKTDAKKKDGDS